MFSVDGKLFQFFRRLLDMLKINVLWILCSLPIVTIGASTAAAFTVTMKMIDETEGYVARQFWKAFKANLKNGIPLGILAVIGLYALWIMFQLVMTGEHPFIFLALFILFIAAYIACFLFAFALTARYENTLLRTIKNSYDICIRYIGRTIWLVVILAVEIFIFTFNSTLIFFFILLGPACLILTISGFVVPMFRELEREDGAVIRKVTENGDAVFEEHPDIDPEPNQDKGIFKRAHMSTKGKGNEQ